jgi:hypothetical protein
MGELSVPTRFENLREQKAYSAPSLVDLGPLLDLTLGGGPSDLWDFAANFKDLDDPLP